MSKATLDAETIHKLIRTSFSYRDRAYAPYSNFHVGAALLTEEGEMIGGCNVENAAYGAGICAERTAMTKAVSESISSPSPKIIAIAITSLLPTPSTSPCGICRQFLREFLPLSTPFFMVASTYPFSEPTPPTWLMSASTGQEAEERKKYLVEMTLEGLLPMSFGPEQLGR